VSGFEDMSDVVDLLSSGTYLVTRPSATTYVNGVATRTTSTFTITASIQPLSPGLQIVRDMAGDGFRNAEILVCYTNTELRTVDAGEPDMVSVFGYQHQVDKVERWNALGNFWRCMLVRPSQ
jgi:hypothetical protein